MAEIIGLIASIGTIASAGFAVAKAISDLADELGSAGKNIKVISVDTKAVALILHEMKRRLDKSTRITQQTLDIACEIASLCKADLESIKQFLLPVLPAGGDKMSMVQKAKWIFVKAKVSAKRVSLNSLKLTITLFLHTLDFIEGDLLDEEYTKDEIKNIAEESKKTKSAFLAAERFDQTLERAYAATLSSNPSTGDENADLLIQLLHHHDQVEGDGTGVLKRLGGHEGDIDFSTNLLQTNQHSQPNSQQSNFQTEESLSDDQFLQIAWHIRTQKNVASYASVVLEKGYQEREITRSEHHREAEGQSNTSQNSSANQHQSVHLHSPQDLPDDDRVSRISDADEQISQRNKSESDSSPAHKAPSVSFSDLDVHCDRSDSFFRLSPRRLSGDSQSTILNTDAQGVSESSDALHHLRSRFNTNSNFDASARPSERIHPVLYSHDDHGASPFVRSHGHGSDGRAFDNLYWQPYPYSTPLSEPPTVAREDPEKEAMKRQLAEIKKLEGQKVLEAQFRKDAEQVFMQKIERMRRDEEIRAEERKTAVENAKKEIEEARKEADRYARQAIEAEMKAAAERKKGEEEAMERAERAAHDKIQATLKAKAESRKGLRRILLKF